MTSIANDDSSRAPDRMLGSVPGAPALGRGPAADGSFSRHEYHHPAAGWGAARSVGHVLETRGVPVEGVRALFVMNQESGGFDCPGCAWPDDPAGLHLDICENGVKHVTWELTGKQAARDFFAAHTVSELAARSDYDLEDAGRLAEPMRYDPASDKYVPISWHEAFELAGSTLRGLHSPHEAAFHASGRLSNEATFLYQLWVREFGANNLPDCSNMCHQASGVAMTAALGTGKGTVDLVFVSLGGNLALAAPDTPYTFQALRKCDLTVHVATKLNRSHIVIGRQALILPCLARTDKDRQAGGEQGVSVEDAMSMVHISYGMKEPVSPHLKSECAILAGLAQATLPASNTPWQWYFNARVRHPHGFRITQPARERGFRTPSARAEFGLAALPEHTDPGEGRLILATIRSHDQFNTTIYSNDDRYRGLKGLRTAVFMNEGDMRDRGLGEFDLVDIASYSRDGSTRNVYGYRAVSYDLPRGCAAGYMPELNVLCGIADHSTLSGQPVTKHLTVEITPARQTPTA